MPDCPYWNFQLNNWWMESLDHAHRITVNKHTATLDEDGRLTIVVAERDPGWGNWIDTAGHLGNVDRHNIQKRDDAKRYAFGVLGLGSSS